MSQLRDDGTARSRGQRAGLTLDMILGAARSILASGTGNLTVRGVAAGLGVAPNAISVHLRRSSTSLERELARDFLDRLSRPAAPNTTAVRRVHLLFHEAVELCHTHPGLARVVVPWIGSDPMLCPPFTEMLLHVLALGKLPLGRSAEGYDVVMAALCGVLSVCFPYAASDPIAYVATMRERLDDVHRLRWPLIYAAREHLIARAEEKLGRDGPLTTRALAKDMAGEALHQLDMVGMIEPG